MNDGSTPPTSLKKTFLTTSTGDTNPTIMLVWFTLLALALHIKSVYWLSQPTTIIKKTPPPIEMTLLAIPLKTADVNPIKPKPIDPPKKKLLPLKAKPKPQLKTLPKPKPAPVAKPKLVAAQPKPIVKTAPMAKALKTDLKETETIAPIVHAPIAAPVAQHPAPAAQATSVKSPPHAENTSKHSDETNNEIVEANYRPNYGSNPKPKYPAAAQRRHLEGKVLLTVRVSAEGDSEQVSVAKSSGHEILDDVAVETVKKWKFVPGRKGNKAIATTVTVPINFKLND